MSVDLLYVGFNRLEYTRQSFAALVANTNWEQIERLYVHDDGSEAAAADYLQEQAEALAASRRVDVVFHGERLGGPVATMNWYLDEHRKAESTVELFAKIDNDFVVCPDWLDEMLAVTTANPNVDILGTEPMIGDPTLHAPKRTITDAVHIGGKGLIRHRAFRYCRMVPRGYFGFTEFQQTHPDIRKAWITPDLPCFGLDQLPFEPWISLCAEYVERGWHRYWSPYHEQATGYWDWWTPLP